MKVICMGIFQKGEYIMKEFLLIDDLIKVLEKDLRERNWIKQHDEVKDIECTQQFYGYSTNSR